MKRDMELVRNLLLAIADDDGPTDSDTLAQKFDAKSKAEVLYHLRMLIEEVGFISAVNTRSMQDPRNWIEMELTWSGQDFLESVRDATIWEETKEGAKKLGGASFDIFVGLAKAYLKAEAKRRLNLDL
jgi:hypothetical protein